MKPARIIAIALTTYLTSLAAQASLVTVDGTFTSFTSWMYDPSEVYASFVNGIPLTSTGLVVGDNGFGTNLYQGNTINFTAPTTSLAFNYDPAVWNDPLFPLVNSFHLTPGGADVVIGQTFQLSTFTFTNGWWFPQADIGFRLTTHSADASLDGKILDGTLRLISVSTDGSDPFAEADFVHVVGRPELGSMRVFDRLYQPSGDPGFAGDFAFMGHIGSLILSDLESVNAAGFTNPSIEPQLVPEPSSALLLLGSGAMLLRRQRTLRTQN